MICFCEKFPLRTNALLELYHLMIQLTSEQPEIHPYVCTILATFICKMAAHEMLFFIGEAWDNIFEIVIGIV